MATKIGFSIIKNPLDIRKRETGIVVCDKDLRTVADLFDRLCKKGHIKGNREWFLARSNVWGKLTLSDWDRPLLPGDEYVFAPDPGFFAVPALVFAVSFKTLATMIALGATIGYSIYSYIDMKGAMGDLKGHDPTKDQSSMQTYDFQAQENRRVDNIPIAVLFGKTRVGGTIINEMIYGPELGETERYKCLLALGEGPMTGVSSDEDIWLGDVRLTEYADYSYTLHTGASAQTGTTSMDDLFPSLYQQHYPGTSIINPCCLYFPFENSYSNMSNCRQTTDSTIDSPTVVNGGTSFDAGTKKFGSYSLRMDSTGDYCYYGTGSIHQRWFYPRSDSFSIHFWMRFNSADWTAMPYLTTPYYIFSTGLAGGDDYSRFWALYLYKINATTFQMGFRCESYEDAAWNTELMIKTVTLLAADYDNDFFHYKVVRDGQYVRFYVNGIDKTDDSETIFGDTPEVYCRANSGENRLYFGRKSVSEYACVCWLDDFVVEQNGSIQRGSTYTVPTSAFIPDDYGYIEVPARGNADKIYWQYRFPKGILRANYDGEMLKDIILMQEYLVTPSRNIYMHCDVSGYTTDFRPYAREIVGVNQSTLIRHFGFGLSYVKVGQITVADMQIGKSISSNATGTAIVCGVYRVSSTSHYIYLLDATGTFAVGNTLTQDGGATCVIAAGGALTVDTQYTKWVAARASYTGKNNYNASWGELKSYTEARTLQLHYPNTAILSLDIAAQSELTQIPKIGVILQGMITKELYLWNGTAIASMGYMSMQNPAWACWAILSDGFFDGGIRKGRGWGLGIHPQYLDYTSFLEWATYCNGTVGIPTGGTQYRCRCNVIFDEKDASAWDALDVIATSGRGRILPIGGMYYAKINQPASAPSMAVTPSMIIEGSYEEEYIDEQDKYDEINIEFMNEDNFYIKDTVGYETADWNDPLTATVLKSDTIFSRTITNTHVAKREAILRLQTSQSVNKRFTFEMDIDAINFEVGDVIKVLHGSSRYGFGGIVEAVSGGTIYLGRTINMPAALYDGNSPILAFRSNTEDDWDQAVITGPWDMDTDIVYISDPSALSPPIATGDPWAIGRDTDQGDDADFDLIRIEEMAVSDEHKVEIIGFNYDETIYYHADYGGGTVII